MNDVLQASTKCFDLIKHYESLHDGDLKKIGLQPKLCPAGYWTIGWGHLIVDPRNGEKLKGPMGKLRALELYPALSTVAAANLLDSDVEQREARVRRLVGIGLKQHEFDALVSFEFNTGRLRTSTLLRRLNAGDRDGASREFMKWCSAKVGGDLKRLPGLVKRRTCEQHLFLTGELVYS